MLILYLVFLCSNFLFIKSEDTVNMTINIEVGQDCSVNKDYAFTEGQTINIVITADKFINEGWWILENSNGTKNMASDLKTTKSESEPIIHTISVVESMKGTWAFRFYYLKNVPGFLSTPRIQDNNNSYIESVCRTNVTIVPKPTPAPKVSDKYKTLLITACSVGAILVIIIITQAAYIVFLINKARKLITLNTHNNLSKRSESISDDTARYCSNPRQKMMKVPDPVDVNNRDSVIYEAPNIEISETARIPMQAPQPPALNTMPRTPRPDHTLKSGPQALLASVMNPARSPLSENGPPNIQRPKLELEVSVANRPPLPLPPHQGHPFPDHPQPAHPLNDRIQEVYEEMETERNTYEPPPAINAIPPRLPMPPKKVPTGNLLDMKENTLKMRQGSKPSITPKPQLARPDTMPKPNVAFMTPIQQELARRRPHEAQTNELEEALRRRNNAMQVPVVSIPDPSSRGSAKPRPPPAPKSIQKGAPVPQPIHEEIYYNENQASSDEEWTYEPLKPLNSYDPNIYNV